MHKRKSTKRHPKKNLGRTKNLDKIQASQAIQKLKSILGFSNKGKNKITPEKLACMMGL
ncbi:hypothetical protein F444_12849 [Phytophthora nicotianae P1976]|uniref:Uncharacterized protein n=2 Tax=Phytophthora nicotianae TaxID=4792 RepID=A0A080ZVN4_PHYNI|nr:hypothetical protein F444_12849 [Phytophthora nicotianae P1976]